MFFHHMFSKRRFFRVVFSTDLAVITCIWIIWNKSVKMREQVNNYHGYGRWSYDFWGWQHFGIDHHIHRTCVVSFVRPLLDRYRLKKIVLHLILTKIKPTQVSFHVLLKLIRSSEHFVAYFTFKHFLERIVGSWKWRFFYNYSEFRLPKCDSLCASRWYT